jgi:hypothetical protein
MWAKFFERLTGWRWHVTMSRTSGEVYMDRWQLLKTRLLSVYINHIRLPDEDLWMHTHPWLKSWSLKLRRWYREEFKLCGGSWDAVYSRVPGRFSRIPKQHRIVELPKDGAWTLFIGWRSEMPWGFVEPESGEVVGWRERAKQRGLPTSASSGAQNERR